MINIAVMGHGVVGSGVVEVLLNNAESIAKRAADTINVKHILDLRDFPDSPLADRFTKDFNDILNDDSVKIVVECMGGLNPAYNFVKSCLLAGKSVVTSNKELISVKGQELLTIAKQNNLNLLFEASVGGGIPIIRPICQCLTANEINQITGILNGTTNFILTKMVDENMSFDDALKMAQDLGYAERDPSADVDGIDTCRKIAILASLSFGKNVDPDLVKTEGIRNVTLEDVKYAEKWGGVIKLIGTVTKLDNGNVVPAVYPAFISNDSQLSSVNDVFNAILVNGNAIGDVMFYGRGAGKLPTASAVVADVVDCVKHISARKYVYWDEAEASYVEDADKFSGEMFVRVKATDYDAALNEVNKVFEVKQVLSDKGDEVAFITVGTKAEILDKLSGVALAPISVIHILK